jgi:L-threonylcarbamoyladenylate synthase
VIDCTEEIPVILRPGGITKEQLEAVIGKVAVDPALMDTESAPKSPGMKYRHYAPNAQMYLVSGSRTFLQQLVDEKRAEGIKVGVLTTEEAKDDFQADIVISCGRREQLETVASSLYETLRAFNEADIEVIFSEMFPEQGVGQAIMNRLNKAASHRIITE